MCGIVGIVGRLVSGDHDRLVAMSECLAHRGPDSAKEWRHDGPQHGALFGHRRLAIIDLRSVSDQPMTHRETGVTLIFNGEIYNFQDLRNELLRAGHAFHTDGDSEVILNGYVAWGSQVVRRLRGMFAFAIHDPRDGSTVFARDGYGIKPLYLADVPEGGTTRAIAFASEVRALLASGLCERTTTRERITEYMWNGFVPGTSSLVQSIRELPPGTFATLPRGATSLKVERYWWPGQLRPDQDFTSADGVEAVAQSVRLHLIADVPTGIFLSGGIDSSAVTALAAQHDSNIETLSIGFAESDMDESRIATVVARAIGTKHHNILVSPQEMLGALDAAIASLDQPSMDGINSWFASRAARQCGWKVALSGAGGDELLGGYSSFRRIPTLSRLLQFVPSFAGTPAAALVGLATHEMSHWSKLVDLANTRGQPALIYQALYVLLSRRALNQLLDQPVAGTWGLEPEMLQTLTTDIAGLSPLRQVTALEERLFLGARLLRDMDAVSMAHSIEMRVPLVDTQLAADIARLPDGDRYMPIGSKSLLRQVAVKAAGSEPFDRKKRGFEFPFQEWMRGPLKATVEDVLCDGALTRSVGLRPAGVEKLWRTFLEHPGAVYWTRIWSIYVLLRWCREHRVTIN